MEYLRSCWRSAFLGLVFLALLGATALSAPPALAAEQAAVPEKNPPGDIPDSQVFVTYKSSAGFSLKVPEGWARSERRGGARFADKFNTIDVAVGSATVPPTIESVRNNQAAELARTGGAIRIVSVKDVKLPAGPAVLIVYESNSEPNPVTNRQLRQEGNRYLLFHNGKLAALDLSAPLGADNVDQWQLIAHSFRWE